MVGHIPRLIVLALVIASVSAQAKPSPCLGRFPWEDRVGEIDGVCYAFIKRYTLDYDQAERYCHFYGGSLAMVKTNRINYHLYYWLGQPEATNSTQRFWIGLSDRRAEGEFRWQDGSCLEFRNFGDGQGTSNLPNGGGGGGRDGEDCVAMDYTGFWFDYGCRSTTDMTTSGLIGGYNKRPFICQFDHSPKTSTPQPSTPRSPTPTATTRHSTLTSHPPTPQFDSNACSNAFSSSVGTGQLDGKCYAFVQHLVLDYDEAQRYCETFGDSLALVKTKEISKAISSWLNNDVNSKEDFWIGLNDRSAEGDYRWKDGSKMGFQNFKAGEGSNTASPDIDEDDDKNSTSSDPTVEDCVATDYSGFWFDRRCKTEYYPKTSYNKRRFICEFKTPNTPTGALPTPTYYPACPKPSTPAPQTTSKSSQTPSTTTPSSSTTASTSKGTTPCAELECDLDCGLLGYKTDANRCVLCACDDD